MRIRPLLALCLLAGCGMPDDVDPLEERAQPIINGRVCRPGEEPTTVGILVEADLTVFGSTQHMKTIICTGTLIAPDTVMLAAHCVDLAGSLGASLGVPVKVKNESYYVTTENDMTALAEGKTQNFPAAAVKARKWIHHPDYGFPKNVSTPGPINARDIALLFLVRPLEGVTPEVVITPEEAKQIATGKPVTIAGYGQTTVTSQWQEPPPNTVGRKMCGASTLGVLGQYEMQVGGDQSTVRKCHGDSGGPTFMDVETTSRVKRRVIGVTSHSYDQTDCKRGGIDTRVDAWRDWLDETMVAQCDGGVRAWCEVKGVIPPSFYDAPPTEDPGSGGDAPRKSCGCTGVDAPAGLAALALMVARRKKARS